MNANRSVNGLLKAGIIANGTYLALMIVQFIGYRYQVEGLLGEFWINVYRLLSVLTALYPLIGKSIAPLIQEYLASLTQMVYDLPRIFVSLLTISCLASLSVSLMGVRQIAAGNRKKGATMAMIGTGILFPLGIIGMIGAWLELKNVGVSATSTTQRPSDIRLNKMTIIGIVLNCIAALSFVLRDDLSAGLKAIPVVLAVICVIGAAVFAAGSKKPGLLIIQIGSIVLVPLGLIAVFGANKTMNELKRSQFHSEAQQ